MYKVINSSLKLFLLSLLLCLTCSEAWAAPIFEFHPLFSSEARYDDNIYLTRSNTRSDWITTVSPGFLTTLSHPRLNITAEYKPGFVYFLHNPQHDYTRYDVNFNGILELTPRLIFSLSDVFLRANDPQIDELVETDYERSIRRNTRSLYNRNMINPQLEYRFGRENIARLYYRNTNYRAKDPEDDDYRENFFEAEFEYWFDVRNALNLMCHFNKANFDLDTDLLNGVDLTSRFIHRFTPHFELFGEYGVGVTDFEENRYYENLDARRKYLVDIEDVEDYDLRKFNVGFEWRLPRNLRIEGSIGYFWREGVGNRDDQGINSLFEIEKAIKNITANVRWESGYSASLFAVRDAGFSDFWRVSTNLTYTYLEKLEFNCRGSYGYNEYTYGRSGQGFAIEGRDDYSYTAATSLTYHILRNYFFINDLFLETEISHIELDSSRKDDGYINNQCMLKLTAAFF